MLFDPARHEALNAPGWSAAVARESIRRIAAAAELAFEGEAGWPTHPLDEPRRAGQRYHNLYFGGGGVVHALRSLAAAGAIDHCPDFGAYLEGIVERNRASFDDEGEGHASYLMGDAGLLLLQWMANPDAALADRLHDCVEGNLGHPAREPLWGNSGTLLAAIRMAELSDDARWPALVRRAVQRLWDELEPDPETGTWIWQQDLYGRSVRFLGAGHGFAGNVFAALRASAWLDAALVRGFADRALATLLASALRDGDAVNWHPMIDAARVAGRLPPVQDCHGAPGIVCRLASMPRDAAWDELLTAAGELSWRAGPLVKGASLCHGTAGSAMACLKLFRRFADQRWLDRARALAMHAIGQVERHRAQFGQGRYTLWTGDLGLACLLWQCVVAGDRFPSLDADPGPAGP